ncbi:MAG: tRNA lysidine(34) synthetase TilS [Bacteroidales bacterium]|nr:tRNA lysidine(34) synthetase TilS [Bacteroidales bacterium]MCM1416164.1 tRNA lysidine(34) synthetase TilS [bacterium]MCM1422731.1 tRNA lysidine(34) synthetase TilS [bacterium]
MSDEIYEKVKKDIDAQDMIAAGDLVVVGVSGGADSICLLDILRRLREERSFLLAAVHVNHGLREEAGEDAAFVKTLCEAWEIPFFLREADVAGYAARCKVSTEEAGRRLRYQAFEEALVELAAAEKKKKAVSEAGEKSGRRRIAVAHNAQDRAETMLFHLFRGSGIKGLSSIRPVREAVIRPLLRLERTEIEAYLTTEGLSWREDGTNGQDAYARNRIRHHILSVAEQEICNGAVAHMGELADLLAETEDYLTRETEKLYMDCVEEASDTAAGGGQTAVESAASLRIRLDRLKSMDPVMQKRVFLRALEHMVPYRKDIGLRHIEGLLALTEKGGSGSLFLPYAIRACKEYDILTLRRSSESKPPKTGAFTFTLWERETIPEDSLFYKKEQNIPENRYTKWFDYDKITTALLLRVWKAGDYLTIDDALHTQALRRYLINEKIPKTKRDGLVVLADGNHVLWVPGYRTSSGFHVGETTKRVLEVQFTSGGNDGGENRSTVDGSAG